MRLYLKNATAEQLEEMKEKFTKMVDFYRTKRRSDDVLEYSDMIQQINDEVESRKKV